MGVAWTRDRPMPGPFPAPPNFIKGKALETRLVRVRALRKQINDDHKHLERTDSRDPFLIAITRETSFMESSRGRPILRQGPIALVTSQYPKGLTSSK